MQKRNVYIDFYNTTDNLKLDEIVFIKEPSFKPNLEALNKNKIPNSADFVTLVLNGTTIVELATLIKKQKVHFLSAALLDFPISKPSRTVINVNSKQANIRIYRDDLNLDHFKDSSFMDTNDSFNEIYIYVEATTIIEIEVFLNSFQLQKIDNPARIEREPKYNCTK